MITSDQAMEDFNKLMNNLRESITEIGLQLVPLPSYGTYKLKQPISLSGEYESSMIGIINDNYNIMIVVKLPNDEENEYDLTFAGFHPDDFINLLDQLEK